jgi:predicted outer membrane repeat protein
MTISNSTISGCGEGVGGVGGGIDNSGTLTLSASTVTANSADTAGGGIYNTGTLSITNGSRVCDNSLENGGADDLYNLGTFFISSDSTVGVIGP